MKSASKSNTTTTSEVQVTRTPQWYIEDAFTALQSASYIIVLVTGMAFWGARTWFRTLVEKHFDTIETLKNESQINLQLTLNQHDTIERLVSNNNVLSRIIAEHLKGVSVVDPENPPNRLK